MLKSTKKYIYILIALTCVELIYAIPFFVDFLLTKENLMFISLIPVFLHVFGYLYISLGYSDIKIKGYHTLGIATIITNMLFPISFVTHLILFIMGAVKLKKVAKDEKLRSKKEIQEELIKSEYELKSQIEEDTLRNEYKDINIDNVDDYFN